LSAFKFIGYYDEDRLRIYETCQNLNSNNISKIYYHKDSSEYLFLQDARKKIPNMEELKRIHAFVMEKEMYKKDILIKAGVLSGMLLLIPFLRHAHILSQDILPEVLSFPHDTQVLQEIGKSFHAIDEKDIRNKLIEMINRAEVDLADRNYRILYYLYYLAFIDGLDNYDFMEYINIKDGINGRLNHQDFLVLYISDKFNYESIMKNPESDALKVTYDNLDMFLELNMPLKQEVIDENISLEEYENYICLFGSCLQKRDVDLHRVWSYKVQHSSMFGELVNLKFLIYLKILDISN